MAEQAGFPQLPTNVWWGVRNILNRNPRTKFDDTTLAIQLDVQPAAARQYLAELKRLGLLTDEGNATDIALRWRMDETYRQATNEILSNAYPEQLLELAPAETADRANVERWFMMQGLGQGTAKNKAATYMMLANSDPATATAPKASKGSPTGTPKPSRTAAAEKQPAAKNSVKVQPAPAKPVGRTPEVMPLNINVQIHISADASSDQIETIFSSMRKYLYGDAIS